jgi:hypothetical protein
VEDERAVPARAEVDRLSVLEHQVRQLTSRLAAWVEAQLVEAMEDRRRELGVLRSELEVVVRGELSPLRSELDALRSEVREAGAARNPGAEVEQRVRQAMMRLTESIEAQLAETEAARRSDGDALRAALASEIEERVAAAGARTSAALAAMQDQLAQRDARVSERLEAVAAEVTSAASGVTALTAEGEAARERTESFEQRVKAAMGRLSDSVEARLGEAATARQDELERFRSELAGRLEAVSSDSARAAESATRVEAAAGAGAEQVALLQQQLKAGLDRVLGTVDARLAEQASAAAAEWHQQLDERMVVASDQAAALASTSEVLYSTVAADGARIEALELHTRRTDAKLQELVDEKYAQLSAERATELSRFRDELEAGVAAELGRLRAEVSTAVERASHELAAATALLAEQRAGSEAALAAQVEEVRAATTSLLEAAREDVAARVAQLDGRRAELETTVTSTVDQVRAELATMADAFRTDVETRTASLEARAAELAERAPELAAADAELAETLASLGRKSARAEDRVRGKLAALGERIDGLAAALERAVAAESGALAPLRSDVRALQDQLAELVAAAPPRPPAQKATAAKKAPARIRRPRQ